MNGHNVAAFEVRIFGSRLDHPKQLHYIPVRDLDEKIIALNSTPHAMRLEETTSRDVDDAPVGGSSVPTHSLDKDVVEVPEADEFFAVEASYEDMMGDIDDLMDMEDDLDF